MTLLLSISIIQCSGQKKQLIHCQVLSYIQVNAETGKLSYCTLSKLCSAIKCIKFILGS